VRAVVQRVSQASVAVGAKLWGLRILEEEKSCSDVAAPLLVISRHR
jgi:D-aminoacyl-tRNA deacylase